MDTYKATPVWGYRLQAHPETLSQASLSGAPDSEKLDKPAPSTEAQRQPSGPQVLQGLRMPGHGRPLPGTPCPYTGAPHSEAQSTEEPGQGEAARSDQSSPAGRAHTP